MAELTPLEKLQPCLLDRLTDEQPGLRSESRQQRVIGMAKFKEGVLRDLRWLFNTQRHPDEEGLDAYPEVARSVYNYGLPEYAGLFAAQRDLHDVERQIADTLLFFEPRIIRHTLQVRVSRDADGADRSNPHRVGLQISADLWAQPMPEKFFAKTTIDLETGECPL